MVTGGSLDTSDSRSDTGVSKISGEVLVSGTGVLTLTPMPFTEGDNSVVPKEGGEDGVGVCLQVVVVSSGPTVTATGLVVIAELIFKASEVLRTLACGTDTVAVVVVCTSSELTTWIQKLPRRRRRSRAISDRQEQELGPECRKLQRNTRVREGNLTSLLLLPTSLPTAKPNLWFNGFFHSCLLLLSEATWEQMMPVTPPPWPWQFRFQQQPRSSGCQSFCSSQ